MKFVMGKHYHNVSLFVDGKDLAETELTALAKQYDRNGIPRITGSDLDKLLRQYTVCDGSPYKRTAVLDGVDMAKYGITGTLDTAHPVTVERTCLPLSEGLPVDMYAIITEHRDGYRNDVDLAKEVAYEHILPESMPARLKYGFRADIALKGGLHAVALNTAAIEHAFRENVLGVGYEQPPLFTITHAKRNGKVHLDVELITKNYSNGCKTYDETLPQYLKALKAAVDAKQPGNTATVTDVVYMSAAEACTKNTAKMKDLIYAQVIEESAYEYALGQNQKLEMEVTDLHVSDDYPDTLCGTLACNGYKHDFLYNLPTKDSLFGGQAYFNDGFAYKFHAPISWTVGRSNSDLPCDGLPITVDEVYSKVKSTVSQYIALTEVQEKLITAAKRHDPWKSDRTKDAATL